MHAYDEYLATLPKVARIDLRTNRKVMVSLYTNKTVNKSLFDPTKGVISGRTQNFLDLIGARSFDIKNATDIVLVRFAVQLFNLDLELCSTEQELKNGTLVFRQLATKIKNSYFVYKVYATGQIRQAWTGGGYYTGARVDHYRLKSPKPYTASSVPSINLIETYAASMTEMIRKYEKKLAKMNK